MLYLFCSAGTVLYKRDALEVLCYPPGRIFRFRYDQVYVEPEIVQDLESRESADGILVFADTVGEPGGMDFRFFPVRRIVTIRLFVKANAVYIDFRLGEFVNYGADETRQRCWHEFLKSFEGRPWPPPARSGRRADQQGWFVLRNETIPPNMTSEGETSENWKSLVQCLDRTVDLAGSTFYLILGFHRVKRRWRIGQYEEILLRPSDNTYDSIYPVPMGRDVVLKVLLLRPSFDYNNPASRRRLKITAGGEAFSGLSKDLIDSESRYNEDRTILICKRVFDTALSTVSIQEPDVQDFRSARATLLTRIKVPRWIVGSVVSGVAISALLLALDADTIKFLSTFLTEPWAIRVGRNAKRIATIAKAISPFPVAASAFLAFKRLPFK